SMFGHGTDAARIAWTKTAKITDWLLRRQESALRRLLREFQEGDPERALQRALPVLEPGTRGAPPYPSWILPFRNVLYSLRKLLGGDQPGSVWMGTGDAWPDLIREYHRAAERALGQGDFRRAAYIYGVLLRDFQRAANSLM